MAGQRDAVPRPQRPELGVWARAAGSPRSDVERWRPGVERPDLDGPPPRADAAVERKPGLIAGRRTATEPTGWPAGTGAASLDLAEWTVGSSVVVSVTGEVDIATTDQLSGALGAALRRGPDGLICDLSGVGFLGAAGLTALLVAQRRAIAGHSWFDLVCPRPLPRRVVVLTGLDSVFSLHDHVAEAITAQARRDGRPGSPIAARTR